MSIKAKVKKSTRAKKKAVRDAAVNEIRRARKKQGSKKKKIPRQQIEAAVIAETSLTPVEVDDALGESYDDMAELGIVPERPDA